VEDQIGDLDLEMTDPSVEDCAAGTAPRYLHGYEMDTPDAD
jgi:hypothetical protein